MLAMMASRLSSFPKDVFPRPVEFLLQSDTNRTADDLANYIQKLFSELDLDNIKIVRCRNWNHERIPATPTGVNSNEQPAHKAQARTGSKGDLLVDTLREFCLKYEAGMEDHSDCLNYKHDVDALMCQVLEQVDIIITTSTGAAKLTDKAGASWQPDGVIIENGSRMKEASSMVSFTKFPEARFWCLVGSHHQTRPFVQERGQDGMKNLVKDQLQVSTLFRYVDVTKPTKFLRTKYGVYGGIEQMPNMLFFDGKLRLPENQATFPDDHKRVITDRLLQHHKEKVTGGREIEIPRVLVSIEGAGEPRVMGNGTSPFSAENQAWVMAQVKELLGFLGGGWSILIVTPYAESARQYRYAIRRFLSDIFNISNHAEGYRLRRKISLEAQTIDAAQGHTADLVFIDFAQDQATLHIRDIYRLCVGLNLARHAEVLVMPEKLLRSSGLGHHLSREVDYLRKRNLIFSVPIASIELDQDLLDKSDAIGSQQTRPGGSHGRGISAAHGNGAAFGRESTRRGGLALRGNTTLDTPVRPHAGGRGNYGAGHGARFPGA